MNTPVNTPLERLWRRALAWRRHQLTATVDHPAVAQSVADGESLTARYSFMVLMSCGIAILGLLQNSAAVIIGAMLISPLMGPIVALGFSLSLLDFRQMKCSLVALVAGTGLALTMAVLVVTLSPLQEPTPEILARTQPTLFDLLVAVFSGLAGGYAVIRHKGEAIVGVAIATALMPPLAVTGYGLATGNGAIAFGAAFLFMTNLLAIALSVSLMAKWYGFGSRHSPSHTLGQALVIGVTFVALSVPLALSLRDIALRSWVERTTRTEIEAFLQERNARLSTLRLVAPSEGAVTVEAVAFTDRFEPAVVTRLQDRLRERLGREVTVSLEQLLVGDSGSREALTGLARLEDTLARLRREQAAVDPLQQYRNQLTSRLRDHFGALSLDQADRSAVVYLAQDSGLALDEARRLEAVLQALDPSWTVRLVPASQALPAISFGPNQSSLDPAALESLETVGWVLDRWNMDRVEVIGLASSDGRAARNRTLARERAEAVVAWLGDRGIRATALPAFEGRTQQPLERELGQVAFRRVEILPQARPVGTPSPVPAPATEAATGAAAAAATAPATATTAEPAPAGP